MSDTPMDSPAIKSAWIAAGAAVVAAVAAIVIPLTVADETNTTNTVNTVLSNMSDTLGRIESKQDDLIETTAKLEGRVAGLERKVEGGIIVNVPVPDTGESDSNKDAAPHLPGL